MSKSDVRLSHTLVELNDHKLIQEATTEATAEATTEAKTSSEAGNI